MKTVTVNGKEVIICGNEEFSYEDICNIAHPPQQSVTYTNGPTENYEGTLSKGKSVKVTNGMRFNCHFTGNA